MNPTARRWMTAFMLALAAHAMAFHLGFRWGKGGPPGPARPALDGPIAVMLVQVAPAAPSAPPETPPEPTPVPEVAPVPEPKPVLTEPAPDVPAVPPEALPEPAPVPQAEPEPEPAPAPEAPAASTVAPSAVSEGPVGPESVDGTASVSPGLSPAEGPPSGGSGGAAPLSSIHPRYPMGSRIRGEEGPVRLRVKIDGRGRPIQTEVVRSSGFFALDAAAVKAVKGARFVSP
ncbi:MAG: TonB family protein, partial [Kiritimatiellia bacterium]